MAYELAFDPEVDDEIADYALRFPPHLQDAVIDCIEVQLNNLAADPRIAGIHRGPRPLFFFPIRIDGIWRDLVIAFRYSQDEKFIVITGFGSTAM